MKFPKNDLLDEVHETVLEQITGTSRWSIRYRRVFKYDGKFYETKFSRGATEDQDERPYDGEGDNVECPEVVPVEKTTIAYERVGA